MSIRMKVRFWCHLLATLLIGTIIPGLFVTLSVTLNTPATPPWKGVVLIIVLLVAGFILSLEPEKKKEHMVERSSA